jgi:hypothetical protein
MRSHPAILWLVFIQQSSFILAVAAAQNITAGSPDPAEAIVGWHISPTSRGTLSLLYSCLITIVACTWTVLHLNVPGRHDRFRTKVLRKVKWMLITVLLPEFIFSKAVCELRLALSDLSEFEKMIQANYKEGFKRSYTDGYGDEVVQFWKWQTKYSRVVRFLYRPMGLPQPPVTAVEEEGKVTLVGDEEQRSGTRNASSSDRDIRGIPPSSERLEKPLSLCMRGALASQHEVTDIQGKATFAKTYLGVSEATGSSGARCTEERGEKEALEDRPQPAEDESGRKIDLDKNAQGNAEREAAQADGCTGPPGGGDHDGAPGVKSARDQDSDDIYTYPIPQHWTLAHAYLANMGGLLHVERSSVRCLAKDAEYYVLTGAKLGRHYSWVPSPSHPLQGLILSEDDIADKSKADWLVKTIAVFQIAWLIVTVFARGVLGLPVTQLEIATTAFSVFAIATYAANFWKPKDVFQPILLQCQPLGIPVSTGQENYDWTQSFVHRLRAPNDHTS